MTQEEAVVRIKNIQSGNGVNRNTFPEKMKGSVARELWHDAVFSYGVEYGYLLAMHDILHGIDSTAPAHGN